MRWAENEEKGWCDKHIEAYVNIAGPVLGVPKAVSACMSGQPLSISVLVVLNCCWSHVVPDCVHNELRAVTVLFRLKRQGCSVAGTCACMPSPQWWHACWLSCKQGMTGPLKMGGLPTRSPKFWGGLCLHQNCLNLSSEWGTHLPFLFSMGCQSYELCNANTIWLLGRYGKSCAGQSVCPSD